MTPKQFPKWAPSALVHLYAVRQEKPLPDNTALLEEALVRAGYPAEKAKTKAAEETSKHPFLPEREKTRLLEKLLTDDRMESVWRNLAKRIADHRGYNGLLWDIEQSITGWRRNLKMSQADRRDYFVRIHNLAKELWDILKDVPIADFTSPMEPQRMITNEDVRYYLEDVLGYDLQNLPPSRYIKTADEFVDYCRFWLDEVVPSLGSVLLNIALVASENINKPQLVKKPGARKAALHYFIKSLSRAMRSRFHQPLHDTVAAIACVVFDNESVDSDLVRKLSRDAPGGFATETPKLPPGNFPHKIGHKSSSKKPP